MEDAYDYPECDEGPDDYADDSDNDGEMPIYDDGAQETPRQLVVSLLDGDARELMDKAEYNSKTHPHLHEIIAKCMKGSTYNSASDTTVTPKLIKTMAAQLGHTARRGLSDLTIDYLQHGLGINLCGFVVANPVDVDDAAMKPYAEIASTLPRPFRLVDLYTECRRKNIPLDPLYDRVVKWSPRNVHFTCVPSPNVLHWFVHLRGCLSETSPARGGEYLIVLICPARFPDAPPEFAFLTENGIYTVLTTALCVAIGKYHANDYNRTLGMQGFLARLIDSMEDPKGIGGGIGIKNVSDIDTIKKHAAQSRAYNKVHYSAVLDYIRSETNYRPSHESFIREADDVLAKEKANAARANDRVALASKVDELAALLFG